MFEAGVVVKVSVLVAPGGMMSEYRQVAIPFDIEHDQPGPDAEFIVKVEVMVCVSVVAPVVGTADKLRTVTEYVREWSQ